MLDLPTGDLCSKERVRILKTKSIGKWIIYNICESSCDLALAELWNWLKSVPPMANDMRESLYT